MCFPDPNRQLSSWGLGILTARLWINALNWSSGAPPIVTQTVSADALGFGSDVFVHRAAVKNRTEFAELAFAEVFVEIDCPLLLFGGG